MTQFIVYTVMHFLGCMLFFLCIQRPMFIVYNIKTSRDKIHFKDLCQIYRYGYKTDLAVAAYLTAIPLLLSWIHLLLPIFNLRTLIIVYEIAAAVAVSLLSVADTALYRFWQFKIDKSVLVYLRNLKGAFASVSIAYIIAAFAFVTIVWAIYFAIMDGALIISGISNNNLWLNGVMQYLCAVVIGVVLCGLLFLAIRGINSRPNSPSIAYYSCNMFFNHAAINPGYNFIYSLSIKEEYKGKFKFFDEETCQNEAKKMFPTSGNTVRKLLNTDRPNIVLIIWESLCAEYVEAIGGKKGVTDNITRLSKEGVLFTNMHATSFRTDRGIVAILSGIIGQPTTSLIKYTKKLPNIPALPRTLKSLGYSTTIMHGGDLSVLHKSDYYAASGMDTLIGQSDFTDKAPTCRWGIHDNYMFDRLYDRVVDSPAQGAPWMITLQTLSSHQPFEVPYHRLEHKISNSYAFVDDALGRFVDKVKKTSQWDNLLIIVTGDHGMNDNDVPLEHHHQSHIPLLLLGGAVKEPAIIDDIVCQTDLPATILGQMGVDHSDFTFSRDITADTYTDPFAMHSFTNGFVFSDLSGYTEYDLISDKAIKNDDHDRQHKGKIILQYLYSDLANR